MKKTISLLTVLCLSMTSVATFAETWATTDASAPVPTLYDAKMIMPPNYGQGQVNYTFDTWSVNAVLNQNSALYEISCDWDKLLKNFGFENLSAKKVKSITFETEVGLNMTADTQNCSISGYSQEQNYDNTKTITEDEALATANAFLKKNLSWLKMPWGTWVITYKTNVNYPMYKVMDAGVANSTALEDVKDPEIISDWNSNSELWNEFLQITVSFPLIISKKKVYDNYGNPVALNITVNGSNKVTSLDASVVWIKLLNRKAKKLDSETLLSMISTGWNSPFYSNDGKDTTVKLSEVEKVLVMFNFYSKGKNIQYLGTWIKLSSDVKLPYDQTGKKYTQTFSDYVIWNNNAIRY